MLEYSSRVLGVISATSRSNVCLFLFVPDLYFLILHYYTGCYLAVISLLMVFLLMHQSVSWAQVLPYIFLLLSWALLYGEFPHCFKHFACYDLTKFLDGAYLVSSFPRHFEMSPFSGFHRYKPQSWKSCTDDHSRENFFRAPFRTETNISLFNILSEFCLFHSRTAIFQSRNI